MNSLAERIESLEKTAAGLEAVIPILQKLAEVPAANRKAVRASAEDHEDDPEIERLKSIQQNKLPRGDQSRFKFVRMFKAMTNVQKFGYDGAWDRFAPFEKQVLEKADLRIKAGAEDTGAGNAGTPANTYGYLVPPQYITDLIEVVRAKTVVRAMGARTMPAASNVGFIPRQSAASAANWIAEAGSITASDLTFQQVQYTIRKLAAYVVLSNELIQDADPAVEGIVRVDIAAAIALGEDITALQGSGAGATPKGIKLVSGVGNTPSMGTNGRTPTFDDIIDAERQVVNSNRQPTAWAVNPRSTQSLSKIKDGNGRPIWEPAPWTIGVVPSQNPAGQEYDYLANADAIPARPMGTLRSIRVFETTQVPTNNTVGSSTDCSDIYDGQWNELVILERGGLEFATSDQILFQNYQTAIRALVRRDFIARHAAAFNVVTGVRP